MTFEVESVSIPIPAILSKIKSDRVGMYAAQTWHKLYAPWVPYDTGTLEQTVQIEPWQITHTVPYAHYIYDGNFNFRRDHHPLASREWDRAAAPAQKPRLDAAVERYLRRIDLNGR